MISAEHLFVLSIVSFFLYALFVSIEKRKGKRLLLSRTRSFFDFVLVKTSTFIKHWLNYVGRHIIKLSWYYSIHRFLQLIMTVLVRTYDRLEIIFMNNRNRARIIKKERKIMKQNSHLEQVADYKESVALSDEEKNKLLAKKLERE